MAKIIKWADATKKEIVIEETKKEKRYVKLENLYRDLENAQKIVDDIKAQIAEIKTALGVS